MQKTRGEIVVCSVYESRVKDIIAYIKRVCPDDQVVFKPLEKGTRFDGSKVVFCHSSLSGRLALTDVNDSIYDTAVKDASRTVGKSNVAFVVTDVQKEDVLVKTKTITKSQRTLMSNTKELLLINNVDDMTDEIRDQFTKFLTDINSIEPPKRWSWSYSARLVTISVVLVVCFACVAEKLVVLENKLNVLRIEVDSNLSGLIKTAEKQVKLHNDLDGEIQALNTSFNESINKHTHSIQMYVKDELGSLQKTITTVIENQVSNTKSLSDLISGLNNSLSNISEQEAKLEREVTDTAGDITSMNSDNLQLHSQLATNLSMFKSDIDKHFLNISNVLVHLNHTFQRQEQEKKVQFRSISTQLQTFTDKTSKSDEHHDKNSNQMNDIISTLEQLKGEVVGMKEMLQPLQSQTCACKCIDYISTMERKSMEWKFDKCMEKIDLRLLNLETLINNTNTRAQDSG